MKKLILGLGVLSSAFAVSTEGRLERLEKQMDQVRTETAIGNYGAKTASARAAPNGIGFYVMADLLYWRAKFGGSEYAMSDSNSSSLPKSSNLLKVDLDWNFGFKVGVGYHFDHDNWDANLIYTFYRTAGSDSSTHPASGFLLPIRTSSLIVSPTPSNVDIGSFVACKHSTSDAGFRFDDLQFTLGRNFYVSRTLSLRPNFGVQSAWVRLKQNAVYSGYVLGFAVDIGSHSVFVQDKQRLWGVGPLLGFESKWYIGRGVSLFCNASSSILYGGYKVSHKNWYSANISENSISVRGNMHQFTTTRQMILGLVYDKTFNEGKDHVSVSLGYDTRYWWALNQMLEINYEQPGANGTFDGQTFYQRYSDDLGINGATLHVMWDF